MMRKITIIALLFGLCGSAIATPPDSIQTIGTGAGRMYADWATWATQDLNLTTMSRYDGHGTGRRLVAQLYNDGDSLVSWPILTLDKLEWITNDSCEIYLMTPESERNDGTWGGFRVRTDGIIMNINVNYIWIDGLALWRDALAPSYGACIFVTQQESQNDIRVSNCILRGSDSCSMGLYANGADVINLRFWNNIIYNTMCSWKFPKSVRLYVDTAWVFNNTAYNSDYAGFMCDAGVVIAKNNIAINCTYSFAWMDGASDYNCSSDQYAPGSHSLTYQDAYDVFADTTQATLDLHLKTNSVCIDSGTDLSADSDLPVTDDVDGDSRPQGDATDMGADEWVTAGEGGAVPRVRKTTIIKATVR